MYRHYNNNQTSLTLPLEISISETHIVRAISAFVDTIPYKLVYGEESAFGRPQYSPLTMLKMMLFAYSRKVFSGRKIQQMAEENIPMKWLIDNSLLSDEAIFIDGTKILSDANKYSFVWRKSTEKFESKLDQKTQNLFNELIQNKVNLAVESEMDPTDPKTLEAEVTALDTEINELDQQIKTEKVIPGGSARKQRRRKLKHFRHLVRDEYLPRKQKYRQYHKWFGNRTIFSKTDHDATFMRMKEDPMQNGQLKPGCNLQIATQSQFILYYQVNQRPTDQRTLISFLKAMNFTQTPVKYIVADAGYGSEQNYKFIEDELGKVPLIPYTMYLKEQSTKYQTDSSKVMNWEYHSDEDYYVDNHNIRFSYYGRSHRKDTSGFERDFKVYQADEYDDPEGYYWSTTQSGNQRRIKINPKWESQKKYVREQLSSPEGKAIFAKRKLEDEPAFGNLKANLRFRRLSVRGLRQVNNGLGIILMAANMNKLALMMANFSYFLLIKEKLDHIFQKVMKNMIQFIYWRDLCPGLRVVFETTGSNLSPRRSKVKVVRV
ncbi:transposase [Lentilactobacillus sp. Marseille-Q4993]|uniref:transposase n=1 Tax=Lentilactobacillus sp. Marseille-Q4993 TaxID=3039492 RepID=UPI0024BD2738|nr:transposase [Lentilactobacillus sp. Marseille-Q4993]